jgi:hypothetical protein
VAKAQIKTKKGATITIEGTPSEVAILVRQLHYEPVGSSGEPSDRGGSKQRATPFNLISTLIDGGFFKKPKDLAAVKVALEELGHFYPVTTLSPALLRLVRKRELRRLKENKRWLYTG